MGTVCKKTYTKPLPNEAKIIVRKSKRFDWFGMLAAYIGLELAKKRKAK